MHQQEQVFKVREKRFSFRVPCIKVPTNAAVSYEDNTIRVYRGNVWLYKFKRIRVLQVYNRPERFLIFYGNAEGRVFPGFGRCYVAFIYSTLLCLWACCLMIGYQLCFCKWMKELAISLLWSVSVESPPNSLYGSRNSQLSLEFLAPRTCTSWLRDFSITALQRRWRR